MSNQRQTWTLDSELDGIVFDPEDFKRSVPIKKVPNGDIFEASRAGDVERLRFLLLQGGVNVNARDQWDSVALYYTCLAGHLDAARLLLENGAICAEHTFDGDRCHYAALNLKVRKLLKAFEARPPPLGPLQAALRDTFLACSANRTFFAADDSPFLHFSAAKIATFIDSGGPISLLKGKEHKDKDGLMVFKRRDKGATILVKSTTERDRRIFDLKPKNGPCYHHRN